MASLVIGTQLKENIKSRYLVTSESAANGTHDNTAPYQMSSNQMTGGTFMSPNLASICEGTAMPFKDFLTHSLGTVTKKDIKALLIAVKKRKITLVSIGYGGISMNLLHFVSLLADYVGVNNVFNKLVIYEDDNLTLMNTLRMYKDTTTTYCGPGTQNKLAGFTEYNLAPANKIFLLDDKFDESLYEQVKDRPDVVYFGAPDFETRKMLENAPFYFVGHGGNDVSIIVRPVIDSELTEETYGQIDLEAFFPNVMRLTVAFLEQLADNTQATSGNDVITWEHSYTGDSK